MKKKQTITRLLAILLCISIVFTITACGSSNTPTKDANKAEAPQSGNATNTAENVTLRAWIMALGVNNEEAFYESVIAEYNKKFPNVTVELTLMPPSSYYQKHYAAEAANDLPDIYVSTETGIGGWVGRGRTLAMDEYLGEDWSGWDDIPDRVLSLMTSQEDGKLHSIMFPNIYLMFYREDYFIEAGLDPDAPPTTPEEFLDATRKLTVKEDGKTVRAGYELNYRGADYDFLQWGAVFGAEGFWGEDRLPNYDTEAFLNAATFMDTIYREELSLPADRTSASSTLFENGLAAITVCSAANYARYKDLPFFDNIRVALPPNGNVIANGMCYAVNKTTKYPLESVQLIATLADAELALSVNENLGLAVIRESKFDEYNNLGELNKLCSDSMDKFVISGPLNGNQNVVYTPIEEQLELLVYGEVTPEEAMKNAQEAALKGLEEIGVDTGR